jgi:FXSXX-COOH protein
MPSSGDGPGRSPDGTSKFRDLDSGIVDLIGVNLADLAVSQDSRLAHALRRVQMESSSLKSPVAGFDSAI